jgi:hypothetical protein
MPYESGVLKPWVGKTWTSRGDVGQRSTAPREAFGPLVPDTLLRQPATTLQPADDFLGFLSQSQVLSPNSACRDAVRKVQALVERRTKSLSTPDGQQIPGWLNRLAAALANSSVRSNATACSGVGCSFTWTVNFTPAPLSDRFHAAVLLLQLIAGAARKICRRREEMLPSFS